MGRITQVMHDTGALALVPTSIPGLYFRVLGFGDVVRLQEAAKEEIVNLVMLDILRDENGDPACDGPEELGTVPPKMVVSLVREAVEYIQGNVPAPPPPARAKRRSKRG